jgi:DNA gyrase/topoisomerase IV subunit B
MSIKINQKNDKEIIALNTFEAVRLRPTMYLGQIAPFEDKLPIIKDGKLVAMDKSWSPGFMHLIIEILENAIDEAKRMRGKMKGISVSIDVNTNRVTIIDEGGGFHKAASKHPKTKKNVVRTAFEELHAGSNFSDTDNNILGTNGVGASIVNILSESFWVTTVNPTSYVSYAWKDFRVVEEEKRGKTNTDVKGTMVSFVPSPEVFPGYKWDEDLITTYLSFKQFLLDLDPALKGLKLRAEFIRGGKTEPISITKSWIPEKYITTKNKLGYVFLWPSYENSCSLAFLNGSQCTGIQQKIINDWVNASFEYSLAHHFYETLIVMDVPSTLMRFADQNKTKYAVEKREIEPTMEENFKFKLLKELKGSDIAKQIDQQIEDRLYSENINKIKTAQRKSKRKISEKYSPASRKKEVIYITEGNSAAGAVKQARDSETEGVYALRGKVKNIKHLGDLTENKEIMEIMSILGITPDSDKSPAYEKIVIATDEDPDGHHISSLIIQLFHRWFPHIINDGRLFKLVSPLVVCDEGKGRQYFQTLGEFENLAKTKKLSNINYLKGLGSLNEVDWEYVMHNKTFFQIVDDRSANKFLEIAFGESSLKRKKWLENGG